MKNPDRDPLWHDTLAESADPSFAETSLARTLAFARRRRHQRHAARTALVLGAVALCSLAIFRSSPPKPKSEPLATTTAPSVAEPPEVRFLTEEELFARFPDTAVALIGGPEDREFIFVNNSAPVPAH